MMGNNNVPAFRLLFLIFSLLIHRTRSYVLQEVPQAVGNSLSERAAFLGGWAVYTPGGCPDQTNPCNPSRYCCPSSTVCGIYEVGAQVCCPDQHDCSSYAEAVPICANTSWIAYTYSNTDKRRVCCQPGQVGLLSGVCVDKGVAVASTELAISVTQVTGTVAIPSSVTTSPGGGISTTTTSESGGNSATATSDGGSGSAVATDTATGSIPTSTATKSSSPPAGAGNSSGNSSSAAQNGLSGGVIGGIVGGVVAGIIIIALLVYLAFSFGKKRSARENYSSNHYGAPAMVEETKMAPPTPSIQSAHPSKYDGHRPEVTILPAGYQASAPNAPPRLAEVGDNRAQAYNRAELGQSL